MPDHLVPIDDPAFGWRIGRVIADARRLIGWSQAALAARAGTSQANVSRIESGRLREIDVTMVARLLSALGIRGHLALSAAHLADRVRQRDPVHARMVAVVSRRLERAGWLVATEVPIGDPVPYGCIDVLAHRPDDDAGLSWKRRAICRTLAGCSVRSASISGPRTLPPGGSGGDPSGSRSSSLPWTQARSRSGWPRTATCSDGHFPELRSPRSRGSSTAASRRHRRSRPSTRDGGQPDGSGARRSMVAAQHHAIRTTPPRPP